MTELSMEQARTVDGAQSDTRVEWVAPRVELIDLTAITNAMGGGTTDSGLS